ncbi:histidine phosphatase family protein [Mesobacillus jeotgali]|uniref:Histidine phosphatase family protein n=1 Tax=Mesobacillus jeotgali TaxID=129985 RepID=A0ABY9VMD3_9BACI|nr:histidine phosphatase family protein [Mesobacillus jeotgali]WNF24888.1 histidine phosphatase family protein [Mesobacillus jeotgali]
MIKLYIARHGETSWNTEKRMQGWLDSDLTDYGIKNAESLGVRLKEIEFEVIYSSPSGRTKSTAELVIGGREIPIIFDNQLREMNLGSWEGQTLDTIKETNPIEIDHFWNAPDLFVPVGGESFIEVRERALEILRRIKNDHKSGNILVVTHTVMIKALFTVFKDSSIDQLWGPPYIHDTSLSVVEIDQEQYRIILEGDISHKTPVPVNP